MGQQNTYRLPEQPGENPGHDTSHIEHYRVLVAQAEPAAKGTESRDLKGRKPKPHGYSLSPAKTPRCQSSLSAARSMLREGKAHQ